jgi:hypothetical protein
LLRCGCISGINKIFHKPSTIVLKETIEYQIWVGQDSAQELKGYSFKTQNISPPKALMNRRFIADGYLWSPILSIEAIECNEEVYNIAVDTGNYDDDSYQVNNLALHNCKVPFDICNICGNKAPSRKQYCEHLKYYMGRIHPETGKLAYAINTMPKFFDISQVLIGADKIAKTLMKVAHTGSIYHPVSSALLAEKMADASKEASIEKEIPAEDPPASQETLDTLLKAIPEVKAHEKRLPREVLNRLGKMPVRQTMSTLAMLGILPKPQEFQRIILVSQGAGHIADELDQRNLCFDPMMGEADHAEDFNPLEISHRNFNPGIFEILKPFISERSYAAPHLGRRMVVIIKSAEEEPLPTFIKMSEDPKDRKPVGILPVLMTAAGLYWAFAKRAPKEALTGLDKLIGEHPGLAAALGLGLAATFGAASGTRTKGQYMTGQAVNPDANDVFARIEEQKQKPYYKVAMSIGPAAKRLFLGIPLAYMASGILQKHKEMNPYEEEGRMRSFARKYPDLISGALAADAVLSLRGKGTHGLYKAVAPKVHTLIRQRARWVSRKFLLPFRRQHRRRIFFPVRSFGL